MCPAHPFQAHQHSPKYGIKKNCAMSTSRDFFFNAAP